MKIRSFLGIQNHTSYSEALASTVGGVLSIVSIFYVSFLCTGYHGALAILPSMGAATVLLFAVPHSALSQPWALFMGNIICAIVGVSCAENIDNIFWAAGLAVGLSIGLMHMLRCVHPPGGATALAAVIGGEGIRRLGYDYVLVPTLLNCSIIFVVALVFNNMFSWRRYPLSLMKYQPIAQAPKGRAIGLTHIHQAVSQLDTLQDISDEQLKQILESANSIMLNEAHRDFDVELGVFYSNGKRGRDWSVRQILDESPHDNPLHHMVTYKTVEGVNKHLSGSCTKDEFALWAKEKVGGHQ